MCTVHAPRALVRTEAGVHVVAVTYPQVGEQHLRRLIQLVLRGVRGKGRGKEREACAYE